MAPQRHSLHWCLGEVTVARNAGAGGHIGENASLETARRRMPPNEPPNETDNEISRETRAKTRARSIFIQTLDDLNRSIRHHGEAAAQQLSFMGRLRAYGALSKRPGALATLWRRARAGMVEQSKTAASRDAAAAPRRSMAATTQPYRRRRRSFTHSHATKRETRQSNRPADTLRHHRRAPL